MSNRSLILTIDQGTTSSRSIVFDGSARPLGKAQVELNQIFPRPGWIERDPLEISDAAISTARAALESAGAQAEDVSAIGIANERETTVIWERASGLPLANAISWQDRRTADMCQALIASGEAEEIWARTGLVVDPYFSASKMHWLMDNLSIPELRQRAEKGEVRFGTIDSWLIDRLTRGTGNRHFNDAAHLTDVTNASRTMLFNIHEFDWDPQLLDIFGIPSAALPHVQPSASLFATTHASVFGREIPIAGAAGDQHAALYGQACFARGDIKCTYGTGAFILANAGQDSHRLFGSHASAASGTSADGQEASGLLFTPAWQIGGSRAYALEGSIFTTGAAVQWLRDGLGIISDAAETSDMAVLAGDNEGVYLVPAFAGLGAPHWDPNARASITGMSQVTDRNHVVRAALESTAYQVRDVIQLMDRNLHMPAPRKRKDRAIKADGGQTRNRFLMQFQSDLLNLPIEVAAIDETTALGAAFMAGRTVGTWSTERELSELWRFSDCYEPSMTASERGRLISGWLEAVRRTKSDFGF